MRWAALVFGVLGALVMVVVGALWTDNADHLGEAEQMAQTARTVAASTGQAASKDLTEIDQKLEEMRRRARACYPMVLLGLVALVAALLVFKLPRVSGAVMAIAAVVPAVLAPISLVFGALLLISALFAFLAKPRVKAAAA